MYMHKIGMSQSNSTRYGRGVVLATTGHIRKVHPSTTSAQLWKVESERLQDVYYSVIEKSDGEMLCDCPDFEHRQELCKHIYAVIIRETT
jgi:uncharacterized Zn finger protein